MPASPPLLLGPSPKLIGFKTTRTPCFRTGGACRRQDWRRLLRTQGDGSEALGAMHAGVEPSQATVHATVLSNFRLI